MPAIRVKAKPVATSSAADELRPAPMGTLLVRSRFAPFRGKPARFRMIATPCT